MNISAAKKANTARMLTGPVLPVAPGEGYETATPPPSLGGLFSELCNRQICLSLPEP